LPHLVTKLVWTSISKSASLRVDIFGMEEGSDRRIIIENQLEDTNHDHLGKIITYAQVKTLR